jgi:hypothetical protein
MSIIEEGGPAATVAAPVAAPAATSTSTSTSQGAQQAAAAPAATGVAVELSGVQARAAAEPAWQLSMEPEAANVTLTAGAATSVGFTVSWSRMKAVSAVKESMALMWRRLMLTGAALSGHEI